MSRTSRTRATAVPPSSLPASASSAVLVISSEIRIAAPAQHCLALLRDTNTWSSWNSFVAKVDLAQSGKPSSTTAYGTRTLQDGMNFTMHVRMDASKPDSLTETKLVVTGCNDTGDGTNTSPLGITWNTAGMPRFALRTERTNEFSAETWEEDDGVGKKRSVQGCRYRTVETMNGPLAYVVKNMYGTRLQEVFEIWAEDFAAAAEEGGKRAD